RRCGRGTAYPPARHWDSCLVGKVLDMRLRGPAKIDHAPAKEGDQVSRAACFLDPAAERLVAIVGLVRLRPFYQGGHARRIECRGNSPWRSRHPQGNVVPIG